MLSDQTLMAAASLQRNMYIALNEVAELTDELAQAVSRQDQVSVRLFLSMRQEEIDRLMGHRAALRRQCDQLSAQDRRQLRRLLAGATDCIPPSPAGEALALQVRNTRSLLERVCRADQAVSLRFGGSNSFYAKKKK